ncbi:TAXI family TRAP transporter solute-binding subunit [Pusillimonas sp.]|uniref:TAXI family TRAP transporter solute-binding subunit n=1 Tax=Pusillimonas sp. TaxID=3040095 RepID=UPI0037C92287
MLKLKKLLRAGAAVGALLFAQVASSQIIVMGGNPQGSIYYPVAQGLANIVSKYSPDTKIDILPQSGTVFIPMFVTGEVDLGIVNPIEARFALTAEAPFDKGNQGKGYAMWTVMQGSPIRVALITSSDSGIMKIEDLKGKRVVANYGAYKGASISVESALANAGLSLDDVRVVNVSSYPEGVRAVLEGRADAAIGSIGSGIVQELDASKGARFLSVDPSGDAMKRTTAVSQAWFSMPMKAGETAGVKEDINVLAYNMTVMSRFDLSDELVTKFIDAVWEHEDELTSTSRLLATWTKDRFVTPQATVPYHPAAVEYYKDKGVWTAEMDEIQEVLLKDLPS